MKRPLSVVLVLAMLLGMMALPADAANSGYELTVLKVQKLTEGTAFTGEEEEVTRAVKGDVVVLTLGFRNTNSTPVDILGYAATLYYESAEVTPYTGTSPFAARPYQNSRDLTDQDTYAWSGSGNSDTTNAYVSIAAGGSDPYSVKAGEELVIGRMAFTVTADNAIATFRFDTDETKTGITKSDRTTLELEDLQSLKLTVGEGTEEPEEPEKTSDYQLSVSKAQLLTAGTAFTGDNEPEVSASKKDEIVVLTISAKNNSDSPVDLLGYAATLYYESAKVTPYTGTSPFAARPYQNSRDLTDQDTYAWSGSGNSDTTSAYVSIAAGGSAAYTLEAGKELVIGRMAFTVTADSGLAEFRFDTDETKTGLTKSDRTTLDLGTLKAYNLVIGDLVPDTVAVTPAKAELTVPATGSATQAFTVEVKDQGGNVMSNPAVTWSLTPDVAGVEMNNGTVTVSAGAAVSADTDFTVTATVGEKNGTATLTVHPGAQSSLTLAPNPATITVPADKDPDPLTFTVTDRNNAPVDASTLTWTLSETPAGVSMNNGTVTVNHSEYTGAHTVTVRAEATDGAFATGQLTIQGAEPGTSIALDSVRLSQEASVVDGTAAEPSSITATAVGTDGGAPEGITWTVTPPENAAENSVQLSATTGVMVTLTVSPTATVGAYTVTATQNAGMDTAIVKTATLTVSQKKASNMTVTGNRASIEIPGAKDPDENARFTATDSNGNPISSNDLTWTVVDRSTGQKLKPTSVDWAKDPENDGSLILTVKPLAREEIVDTHDASRITGKTLTVTATRSNGDSASAFIVVRRADSVLSIVTLTLDSQSTSTGGTPLPVTSDGNTQKVIAAQAKDQYEEPFDSTAQITWALRSGGNGLVISGSGVDIDANTGAVTVNRNAKPGTYIVEATRTVLGREQPASAEFTVSQVAEEVSDLTLSGGTLEMEVPAKGADDNVLTADSAFVAQVFNQYGSLMPNAPVNWSVTDSTGREYPGVIDIPNNDGRVRVAYAAKDIIPANTRPIFTVKASSGSVEKSEQIYIVRATPRLDDILLDGQNSITKSIDGAQDAAVQGTALDQYETVYTGAVTWNIQPVGFSSNGTVAIDPNSGLITIAKNANPGNYSVTAAQGANPSVGPKNLLVTRGVPVPTSITISGGQPTIWVPGDDQDPAQSVPFVATVKDQFGSEMPGQTVVWSITDENNTALQGITISDGVVAVTNEVKGLITTSNYASFKTMTIRAECGAVSAVPASIIVGRALPVLTKVQLNGTDSPDSSNNKATFEYRDGQNLTITATALDQYGTLFRGASWSIFSYTDKIGVSIDTNGLITISNGAVSGEYIVTAQYGSQAPSAPFLIRKTGFANNALAKVVIDPSTVTVSGNSMAISQATAYDGDNNAITRGLLWSVYPANSGVTVDGAGKITVSPNAVARPYVITATPDATMNIVSGNAQSADLLVQTSSSATAELDHIALTKSAVTVNGTAGETSIARAYDKDNREVTGVTWLITPSDGGVGIDGNGMITVFRSAAAGNYTISATKNGVSRTAVLTVTSTAATSISAVTLTPATVLVDGSTTVYATAKAVDSGNAPMANVTWSIAPNDKGVTIDASGAITIAGNSMTGDYTVIASNSAGSQSAVLRVTDQTSPPDEPFTGVTLDPSTVTLDGANGAAATATAQGTATDGVTWSVSPADAGVTIDASGHITIAATAASGDYVITGTRGLAARSATLHVTATGANPSALSSVSLNPSTVTVDGTAAKTAAATALDTANQSITSGIAWSVSPLGNGVSVNALTGVVTVDATAAGRTYSVIATQGKESRSATLTVSNTASNLTLASVSLNPDSVTLNGTAGATSTATAIASNNTTINAGITWAVSPAGSGVSIDTDGKITVTATAASGAYTVSAQYQTTVRSATLTVESGTDVTYEDRTVDQTAVAGTPLASLSYADTGLKSAEDQSSVKSAALTVQSVQQAISQKPEGTETEVVVSMDIKLQSYDAPNNSLKLSVTPVYEVVRTANGQKQTVSEGTLSQLSEPVTVSLNVPADFNATFAKHTHNNVTYYEPLTYSGTAPNRVASWPQQYFSDVELGTDGVTVKFDANGGSAVNDAHIATGGKLSSLPATTRTGYTFGGWYLNGTRVDTNTVFSQNTTLVAQWIANSGGGGSSSGGGGSSGGGSGGSSSGGGGGGSSSSGSSSGNSYTIKLDSGTGGSLSASSKRASAESIITVTPTPNAGYELDTLTVQTTSAKKAIAVTNRNGVYTFEMPKAGVTVSATFKVASQTAPDNNGGTNTPTPNTDPTPNNNPTPSYNSVSFVDVPSDNFFYTAVQWAIERGITNGTTATTFSPNQACTRAQMVMFLWRSQGMPMPSTYSSPFTDVDPSANYYTAMMWAIERGITNGTTPTTFEPYASCTRAQMVMFLHRLAGRPSPTRWDCPFTDITVGENYYIPMLWALERGITNGTTATTFSPYQACTRAQMVMFLYRYFGGN